jgi:hypothetical protein
VAEDPSAQPPCLSAGEGRGVLYGYEGETGDPRTMLSATDAVAELVCGMALSAAKRYTLDSVK